MLISLSTLKIKSETEVDYQRRCIHAGGGSVTLLDEIGGTPLYESRMLKFLAHTDGPECRHEDLVHPDANGMTRVELSFVAESVAR